MPIKPRKKAIGYARVSSECQSENTSIGLQTEKIKEYCSLYDYDLMEIFIDNGRSGCDVDSREGYTEMLEMVKTYGDEISALIVHKSDRIHRRLKNLLIMIEDRLIPNKVAFISITENFDTSTAQGMLFLQMIGSFAEFERKQINDRTKSGRVKTATSRQYAGGEPPYGYKVRSGKLLIDQEKAAVIADIFREYAAGNSISRIAQRLDDEKIPTKKNNSSWSRQTIGYILRNPAYKGVYRYHGKTEQNGIENPGQIPPIVSLRLWNKVQRMINGETVTHKGRR